MTLKSVYSEPLLPQNKARQLTRSGDQSVDGIGRALERIRAGIVGVSLKRFITLSEPVGLKKDTDKETQFFSQPRMSDLWYLWDVQDDPLEDDEDAKDYVEDNLKGAKLVRTVIGTNGSNKRRAFTMDYEWVPDGESPSIPLGIENAFACLEFLVGDLAAAESTLLLGEETGKLEDIREGTKLLPPLPSRSGGDEEVLTHAFYLHEDDVKILNGSELSPFTVMRKGLRSADKFPTPGEFIGMAVRAWPNHAWFSQESNPFIFSANWFDTNYYSSGKVEALIDINENGSDFAYDVKIRGKLESSVLSTDFLTYAVGDRVALLKLLDNDVKFTNKDMKENGFNPNWRIIPITFFKE